MKTILITGCSTGIGKHCAIRLKEAGWRVFATARNPQDINMLQELGLDALELDYTDSASIKACFDAVLDKSGGQIDACPSCANRGMGELCIVLLF